MEEVETVPERRDRLHKNSELVKIRNTWKNSQKEAIADA